MTQWQFTWNEERWWCHFKEAHYHFVELTLTEWATSLEAELPLVFTSQRKKKKGSTVPAKSLSLHVCTLPNTQATYRDGTESSRMCGDVTLILLTLVIKTVFHQTFLFLALTGKKIKKNKKRVVRCSKYSSTVQPPSESVQTFRLGLIAYLHHNWVYNQTISWTQRCVFITSEYPFINAFGQWLA